MWFQHLLESRYHKLPDRPVQSDNGSSQISGLYFAGSLSGKPNIASAIQSGSKLAKRIVSNKHATPYKCDAYVGIIGAGPSGISLAVELYQQNVPFVIFEQGQVFNNIRQYPQNKPIFRNTPTTNIPEPLTFQDSSKEDLLRTWEKEVRDIEPFIYDFTEVIDIHRYGEAFKIHTDSRGVKRIFTVANVVMATGVQNEPNRLNIPGEEHPMVQHHCYSPHDHINKTVAIIGGGRTAAEVHLMLAEQGTSCIHIHRGPDFSKAGENLTNQLTKTANSVLFNHTVSQIETKDDRLCLHLEEMHTLSKSTYEVDSVLVLIGGTPTSHLLKEVEYPTEQQKKLPWGWLTLCTLFLYLFYILKSGTVERCIDTTCFEQIWMAQRNLPPFDLSLMRDVPALFRIDIGFRIVDGAFWCSLLYSLTVLIFGLKAIHHYNSPSQRNRYLSLIAFQGICLFGIPEVIAPALIESGTYIGGLERPWKLYSAVIPWPLSLYSVVDYPSRTTTGIALAWTGLGLFVTLVLIPVYVKYQGQRFCSYLCGCGGLAETLGDTFRLLAPKGPVAKQLEKFGRIVFVLAILVTLLLINDAWALLRSDALYNVQVFASHWYGLMIDFWLAGVVGVALYPILGNRIWCRYACPLRAYMEIIAQHTSKISIESKDTCIGCYECTRQCQMGIEVDQFALRQLAITPQNSSCIQCGICIEACPLDVLTIGKSGEPVRLSLSNIIEPPKPTWHENNG